jgi:hypothetical protein
MMKLLVTHFSLDSCYGPNISAGNSNSTEVTALYMSICDEKKSPFQISVSSSGSEY